MDEHQVDVAEVESLEGPFDAGLGPGVGLEGSCATRQPALVDCPVSANGMDRLLPPWLANAAPRMHRNKLAAALANKLARIAWSVLSTGKAFDTHKLEIEAV